MLHPHRPSLGIILGQKQPKRPAESQLAGKAGKGSAGWAVEIKADEAIVAASREAIDP